MTEPLDVVSWSWPRLTIDPNANRNIRSIGGLLAPDQTDILVESPARRVRLAGCPCRILSPVTAKLDQNLVASAMRDAVPRATNSGPDHMRMV
jgi:hypothetical protein